ncbi:MAG: hypothetical protein Q4D80_05100, partial [Pseudomonadota bacterium]|nr:hypothetical protein [Pseudomonadota bacterium]
MSKILLIFQRVIFTLFITTACLCYVSAASARTCFLPDSEDCGENPMEVPDANVNCTSYDGYDTESDCRNGIKNDIAVVCSLNNSCYYPYCQYSSERACLKDITSSEKCLSKNVTDLDKTCWYKTGKTCSELNAKYVSNSGSCQANYKKQEVPGVSGSDGQCYTCEMNKTCKQLNAGYYTESELCPENTDRKDTGKTGSDGKCYTCENRSCSDSGWQVSGSCGENYKETAVGTGIEGTCVTCTLKTCKEINGSWMPEAECKGIASSTGNTGADGECCTCSIEECPADYSIDVTSCPSGYKLDKNGKAYGKDCGKCLEEKCPDGYDVKVTSCSEGYELDTNGTVAGKACGQCFEKKCTDGYSTDVTSCPDGYELKTNGKSGTKTCGKCFEIIKPEETCTYTYYTVSPTETRGASGDLDVQLSTGKYKCEYSTSCHEGLRLVGESIKIGGGTPYVQPIYNRISNASKSCVRNGKTYYEKICAGTPKDQCSSSKVFTPNGCVSDGYQHGFEVKGTEWGTCGCDTSAGKYDTANVCQNNTGKLCAYSGGCYQTCETFGYYSTEDACKNGMSANGVEECRLVSGCYRRVSSGFTIALAQTAKTYYTCDYQIGGSNHTGQGQIRHYLLLDNGYPTALNGYTYPEMTTTPISYKAGTYYLCTSTSVSISGASNYGYLGVEVTSLHKFGGATLAMCF